MMQKRISQDINNLRSVAKNTVVEDNIITFTLIGPPDSFYENGEWKVRIQLSKEYPYKSPSVGFLTKIYHPNVDFKSGSICLNVLNQTWSPIYNLSHIHDTFLPQLLLYPNAEDPLNQEAADLYLLEDKTQFKEKVNLHMN